METEIPQQGEGVNAMSTGRVGKGRVRVMREKEGGRSVMSQGLELDQVVWNALPDAAVDGRLDCPPGNDLHKGKRRKEQS